MRQNALRQAGWDRDFAQGLAGRLLKFAVPLEPAREFRIDGDLGQRGVNFGAVGLGESRAPTGEDIAGGFALHRRGEYESGPRVVGGAGVAEGGELKIR